tara:strand:+ start:164 stop:475 length:312 start_codon:yes stop_codon:yes gene_type:complete
MWKKFKKLYEKNGYYKAMMVDDLTYLIEQDADMIEHYRDFLMDVKENANPETVFIIINERHDLEKVYIEVALTKKETLWIAVSKENYKKIPTLTKEDIDRDRS